MKHAAGGRRGGSWHPGDYSPTQRRSALVEIIACALERAVADRGDDGLALSERTRLSVREGDAPGRNESEEGVQA